MTSPTDKSAAQDPAASPSGPLPVSGSSPPLQETRGASGEPERRPYVRLMAALGGMGAVAALIGVLVGFTTDPAFPLPEKLPTLPTRPGMPSGLPTGPGTLPSGFPTGLPTEMPTGFPTGMPTGFPTDIPTEMPTGLPTDVPTEMPTGFPTDFPTEFSGGLPSGFPADGSIPKSGGTR